MPATILIEPMPPRIVVVYIITILIPVNYWAQAIIKPVKVAFL